MEKPNLEKCQKSILERQASPTFEFLIEMRQRHYWVTHRTEKSVDLLLRGKIPQAEVRARDKELKVVTERSKAYDQCDAYYVLHFLEVDDLSICLAFCVLLLARNITLRVVIFLVKVQKSNLRKPFALLFR
ncbi:hypothetical protein ACFX1X_002380 [Malus domestica]